MSKSFAIKNGDLQVGIGRAYNILSGKDKLLQDLRLWVTERVGTDPLLSTYGSTLDGGIIDGQVQESYIGTVATQAALSEIRIAVLSLIQQYQQMQFAKMQDEALLYDGNNTLDQGEVIDTIDSIQVVQLTTTILVQVVISTLAGSSIKLTVPLSEGS